MEGLIESIGFTGISLGQALIRLFVSTLTGFIISFICYKTHKNDVKKRDLAQSIVLLNIIICMAMMAIGNNLASAFGLVGAVSIIRFRTSVKSSKDMSFVFFTIVTGMGCGLGYIFLTLTGFILVSLVIIIISVFDKRKKHNKLFKYKVKLYLDSNSPLLDIETLNLGGDISSRMTSVSREDRSNTLTYIVESLNSELKLDIFNELNKFDGVKKIKIQDVEE